ncbi:hypothetical protein [Teichococcus vastitatis]|uniref:Uncharacterized protein n=1 Tax=Teichococcus vastitatis TaxID=2307076 RepID=A0ABS9WBL6_9PROT|nr:hypothetical protein [Pseudoroseomonas vastitatis]MCI0756702.1 hypothetical protein [Pseudoroseomonas vastitatis]
MAKVQVVERLSKQLADFHSAMAADAKYQNDLVLDGHRGTYALVARAYGIITWFLENDKDQLLDEYKNAGIKEAKLDPQTGQRANPYTAGVRLLFNNNASAAKYRYVMRHLRENEIKPEEAANYIEHFTSTTYGNALNGIIEQDKAEHPTHRSSTPQAVVEAHVAEHAIDRPLVPQSMIAALSEDERDALNGKDRYLQATLFKNSEGDWVLLNVLSGSTKAAESQALKLGTALEKQQKALAQEQQKALEKSVAFAKKLLKSAKLRMKKKMTVDDAKERLEQAEANLTAFLAGGIVEQAPAEDAPSAVPPVSEVVAAA